MKAPSNTSPKKQIPNNETKLATFVDLSGSTSSHDNLSEHHLPKANY